MQLAECRSCQAPIVWMVTTNGKRIPVDPEGVDEAELEFVGGTPLFDPKEHTSHFATCPHANQHRRSR